MIKNTTKKLLLWLYAPSDLGPRFVLREEVRELFPELSSAGWLSLLAQAQKKGYVVTEKSTKGEYLRLTSLGREALSQVFPALSPQWQAWTGEWGSLVCIRPPKADPNFRALRLFLLKQGLRPLTRGVYLYPWPLPAPVLELCRRKYGTAVGVTEVSHWTITDFRAIIGEIYGISDLFFLYSGISSEADRLLIGNVNKKGLNYQSKKHLTEILDRFLQILAIDPGFYTSFFPQDISGEKITLRLQLLAAEK